MTLDVAIITYQPEGIKRVDDMDFPTMGGVRYVISWQNHENAPIPARLSNRTDVIIYRFDKSGLSLNRNNVIEHCSADIILLSDDDLTYTKEGLRNVITTFEENPDVDVATFKSLQNPPKRYPDSPCLLNAGMPKGYQACTIEIALRRQSAGHLRCCPELGLGSPLMHGGEDEMLIQSAIKRKLTCVFFPLTICVHPGDSTGTKSHLTDKNLRASGCTIALMYPLTAVLRIPLKAYRVARAGKATFFRALRHLASGAMSAPAVLSRNHDTLW